MKRRIILVMAAFALLLTACGPKYETVKGDPLKT